MGKTKYDFICSLGGNCSCANNLKFRKLRFFSYPFDWTYIMDDTPLYKLIEGFKTGFENFFLKENLKELKGEEYNPNHKEHLQYKDTYSGYYYVNHFVSNMEKEYDFVYKVWKKRIRRLEEALKRCKKALFILSTSFYISEKAIIELSKALRELYPNKRLDFVLISFECPYDEAIERDNIKILRYKRSVNPYDFQKTNYEWSFLDNIKINRNFMKNPFFKFLKIKKGFEMSIFPVLPSILSFRLYFLSFRMKISLGKLKEEQ